MTVDLHFGDTSQMSFVPIGEPYPFRPREAVHNGGAPADGNVDGEGYVVCPACDKDFFVIAVVIGGILSRIEVAARRPGYVP